jgi:hypothetical protein
VTAASAILARLAAIGARVERRGDRVVICAGRRPVPTALIEEARAAKAELSKMLITPSAEEVEHLRTATGSKAAEMLASVEDAQMSTFDEHLRPKEPTAVEDAQIPCEDEHLRREREFPRLSEGARTEDAHLAGSIGNEHLQGEAPPWSEAEEERAAIVEHDGGVPQAWAEGFARLDPTRPPGDVPPRRWLQFVDDVGRFLDSPFRAVAASLGWGPYDLFGCDRDRPFARIDCAGLLWLLNGDRLVELREDAATIESGAGVRHTWRRKPNAAWRVLVWEIV